MIFLCKFCLIVTEECTCKGPLQRVAETLLNSGGELDIVVLTDSDLKFLEEGGKKYGYDAPIKYGIHRSDYVNAHNETK